MTQDPYTALGLSRGATADEIKKAYRKIARTNHPDLNPDDPRAEARFKEASHAYDLSTRNGSQVHSQALPRKTLRVPQILTISPCSS